MQRIASDSLICDGIVRRLPVLRSRHAGRGHAIHHDRLFVNRSFYSQVKVLYGTGHAVKQLLSKNGDTRLFNH